MTNRAAQWLIDAFRKIIENDPGWEAIREVGREIPVEEFEQVIQGATDPQRKIAVSLFLLLRSASKEEVYSWIEELRAYQGLCLTEGGR